MISNGDVLKCDSQWPKLIYMLAILIIFFGHLMSLITTLKCFYKTLSELGVNKLLHLLIVFINFSFNKGG